MKFDFYLGGGGGRYETQDKSGGGIVFYYGDANLNSKSQVLRLFGQKSDHQIQSNFLYALCIDHQAP